MPENNGGNTRLTKLEELVQTIQEHLVVMAHLEKRQSELLLSHANTMANHASTMASHDAAVKRHDAAIERLDERIERLVSAIGEYIAKH